MMVLWKVLFEFFGVVLNYLVTQIAPFRMHRLVGRKMPACLDFRRSRSC